MMSARERKLKILSFLSQLMYSVTIGEVGRGVELKRTPYLERLLTELVEEGSVLYEWIDHPKYGRTRYFWFNQEFSEQ